MTSKLSASLVFGAACLLGLGVTALLGTPGVLHSYLAAWLVLLALPTGALPLVMALEILPLGSIGVAPTLRRFLWLMPVAAILALPVLIGGHKLYPDLGGATPGVPGFWNGTAFFFARALAILLVWTGFALVFARQAAAPRPGLAGLGLALHFVFVTVAAQDWILSLEPTFTSSAAGLLLLVAQGGLALAAAIIMARRSGDEAVPPGIATALALALALWLFLSFTQYLVVWSANLPAEAAWYRHRSADLGLGAEIAAGLICVVAFLVLLRDGTARSPGFVTAVAALILLLHVGGMLWLVTPAIREHFSVTVADLLAVVGLAALGVGLARVLTPADVLEEASRG